MKRTPMMQNQAVEVLTLPDKLEKQLNELRVNEGINLYVEDHSNHPKELETTLWEREFELEVNRFTIKFNLPSQKKYD